MSKEINALQKIKAATLLSLLFVILFGLLKPTPISSRIKKEEFWANKTHGSQSYNIVFCGDSRLYRGISSSVVSNIFSPQNTQVLNFGYSSGGLSEEMFKRAENKLVNKNEIRAIVLAITPFSLTPEAKKNEHLIQEIKRDWNDAYSRKFIYPLFYFFEPTSPLEISNKAMGKTNGYYETFEEDGWVKSYEIPESREKALNSYRKEFKNNLVDNQVIKEMCEQIQIWAEKRIQVFAFRMPTSAEMAELENTISGYDNELVRKSIEESGGKWLTTKHPTQYHTYDGSHLHYNSAIHLSEELGKQLKSKLGQSN